MSSHIIGQQIFEINFSSADKSHELQNKISSIFHNQLIEEMEKMFDRVIPKNKLIRLDNLSIDIGNIPLDSLDTELVYRIIEKLEQELLLLLLHDNTPAGDEAEIPGHEQSDIYLGLLEYFLLKGSLPWWAGGENLVNPFEALEFLLIHSPQELKSLILRIGQRPHVRTRLVYQFSEEHVRSVIRILEPEQAEFIFEYHAEVIKVHQEKEIIKSETSEFKKAVWVFILTYLLDDRGSHFNRKEFVKSTLMSMSAHFNVDFSELLALFATALDTESRYMQNTDSLQSIILELSIENDKGTIQPEHKRGQPSPVKIEEVRSDMDMLRYYLSFGSFPWWSGDIGREEISRLVLGMIKKYPLTMESMIRDTGRHQYTRGLIVRNFDEGLLKEIVKLIEPENAEFIFDYVEEVKTVHTKNAVIKAQTEDLTQSIWEFILEFLLVDRGSEFNRLMFLESNIRKLAGRFNVSYRDLLVFMVQNIAVSHHSSSRHIDLFEGLTILYKQNDEKQPPSDVRTRQLNAEDWEIILEQILAGPGQLDWILRELAKRFKVEYRDLLIFSIRSIEPDSPHNDLLSELTGLYEGKAPAQDDEFLKEQRSGEVIRRLTLKNVLYFWLRSGYLPWWAEKYRDISPSELLDQFITISPEEAIIFLRYAGQKLITQQRMIYQIPLPVLFKIFQLLPYGSEALQYSGDLATLIKDNKTVRFRDQQIPQTILAFVLWDIFIESSYKSFKPELFIKKAMEALALWLQVPVTGLFNALKIDRDADYPEQFIRLFDRVYRDALQEEGVTAYDILQLPGWLKTPEIAGLKDEALEVLRYFLQHNKLPAQYKISGLSVDLFLKELLLFLYQEKPSSLESLLSSSEYRGENFIRLHEIFAITNTIAENNVSKLLMANLEKHMLLYIRQHSGIDYSDKNVVELIDSYLSKPLTGNTIEFLKRLFKYPSVSMQLAYYYEIETVYRLLGSDLVTEGWGVETVPFLKAFYSWLLGIASDIADKKHLDLLFRAFSFLMIAGNIKAYSVKAYLQYFIRFLYERNYQLLLKLSEALAKPESKKSTDPMIVPVMPLIRQELRTYTGRQKESDKLTQLQLDSDDQALKAVSGEDIKKQKEKELKQLKKEIEQQEEEERKKSEQESPSDEGAIYVNNAGLVLLHPFLSTYFNRLQMLEKGNFVSEEARHRAVHLLQYLAYGTEINEEQELVLNKILCNMPIEEPLEQGISLTEEEKTVSAELLNVVIARWEKLKNTSAESLQASFLQRKGSLIKNDEGWKLRVEQKGYDVLLQTLPWGIGMVKMPWMTEFIYVEWM